MTDDLRQADSLPVDRLTVLVMAMLAKRSELQERLGLIDIDHRIADIPRLKQLAVQIAGQPGETRRTTITATLDEIGRLEREIALRASAVSWRL